MSHGRKKQLVKFRVVSDTTNMIERWKVGTFWTQCAQHLFAEPDTSIHISTLSCPFAQISDLFPISASNGNMYWKAGYETRSGSYETKLQSQYTLSAMMHCQQSFEFFEKMQFQIIFHWPLGTRSVSLALFLTLTSLLLLELAYCSLGPSYECVLVSITGTWPSSSFRNALWVRSSSI